jgi:hypothetical protein
VTTAPPIPEALLALRARYNNYVRVFLCSRCAFSAYNPGVGWAGRDRVHDASPVLPGCSLVNSRGIVTWLTTRGDALITITYDI